MTNYKEIELLLKHGVHVGVKNKNEEYLTISPIKDADGDYRVSGRYDTLEKAKQNIGEYVIYPNLEEVCKDWTEITPFHLDFEPYPEGMMVKIVKHGYVQEIEGVVFNKMYTLKGVVTTSCSHTEFLPYFEEEPTEMTIKEIEEKLNITGLKIIK